MNEYLRTSEPDIYAAGDIAAWPDPTFGRRLRVEHWDVARGQGLRAGRNMAGQEKPYISLPYFFSDLFDLSFEVRKSMPRYGVRTKLSTEEVLEKAEAYFVGELGLEKTGSNPCCSTFEGGGGHVTVTAQEGKDVVIVAREWDYQVREFMAKIA